MKELTDLGFTQQTTPRGIRALFKRDDDVVWNTREDKWHKAVLNNGTYTYHEHFTSSATLLEHLEKNK